MTHLLRSIWSVRRATVWAVVALAVLGVVGYAVLALLRVDATTLLVYAVSSTTAVGVAAVAEVAALADARSTRAEFERQLRSIASIGAGLLMDDLQPTNPFEQLRVAYHSENALLFQDARQTRNAISTMASLGDYAYYASDRWLTQIQREPLALFVENLGLPSPRQKSTHWTHLVRTRRERGYLISLLGASPISHSGPRWRWVSFSLPWIRCVALRESRPSPLRRQWRVSRKHFSEIKHYWLSALARRTSHEGGGTRRCRLESARRNGLHPRPDDCHASH